MRKSHFATIFLMLAVALLQSRGVAAPMVTPPLAPGNFNINSLPQYLNKKAITVTWSVSTNASSYVVSIDQTSTSCTSPIKVYNKIKATKLNLSVLSDGSYFICVSAVDNVGKSYPAGNSGLQVMIDTVAPKVSISPTTKAFKAEAIQATATDTSPLTYEWNQTSGPGVVTFSVSDSLSTTVSATVSGSYTLKLIVRDAAGNQASASTKFVWNTLPPRLKLASTISAKEPNPL